MSTSLPTPSAALPPMLNFAPDLLLKAQGIQVVFFDVDGVLTDGSLYFTETGESIKRFHTLDGHGLKLLQRAGITPAVITLICAPPNAHQEVKAVADHVTIAHGGNGAVREVCDLLLIASGRYASLLAETAQ